MQPQEGEFIPVFKLEPGVPNRLPAVTGEPVYIQLGGHDVLSLVLLSQNSGSNVPALLVDPADPKSMFEGIRYGIEHSKIIGRGLGRLSLGPHVSRKHVSVHLERGTGHPVYVIEDLHSTNGTNIVRPADAQHATIAEPVPKVSRHDSAVSLRSLRHESTRAPKGYGFYTKASDKHPNSNEDACVSTGKNGVFGGVFAVFDGVGGREGGVESSTLAAKDIQRELAERSRRFGDRVDRSDFARILKDSLVAIDGRLFRRGQGDTNLTTATVMLSTPWGEAVIANAGDSRAYVMRSDKLLPLTKDNAHGSVFDGPLNGDETYEQRVMAEMDFSKDASEINIQEAFHYRHRIQACLGMGMSEADSGISITYFMPQTGDIVLLSTDGVHDNLKDSEIARLLKENTGKSAEQISKLLVDAAHRISERNRSQSHRPKPDDMTAVVVTY